MRFIFIAAIALVSAAHAQSWPVKPVHLIVPFAAGGGPDIQARQFAIKLESHLGKNVIVENKVGAAGVLAAQYVAQQPPDGYTVLLGANTHLVQKHLSPELKFDPVADFAPITNMASTPTVLVVRADDPAKSVHDLIARAKANPGQLNYGSGGIGTSAHLAGATLQAVAGVKIVHIPLKGSVEIAASLLRGDTQFAFPVAGTAIPNIKSGKLRALGTSGAGRLKELPDVPVLAEVLKNELYVQESWFGPWAPAKTPIAVLRAFHAAGVKALADPQLIQQFEASGGVAVPSESPEAFAAFVRKENAKWAQIAKFSTAKAD